MAQAVEVIRESGLPQETNALFTNVEGDLDDVLKVAGEAAKKLRRAGVPHFSGAATWISAPASPAS